MSWAFPNKQALRDKVDWEGGVTEAILGYGIPTSDLPPETPAAIADAWKRVEAIKDDHRLICGWLWGE